MKKYLVMLMVVIMSAAMFAGEMRGPKNDRNCEMREDRGGFALFQMASKEDFVKTGVTEDNYNKAKALLTSAKTQFEKNNIAAKQKELEAQKLSLEENKNWTEIEKNLNDAAKIEVDTKIKQMKLREEIKKYVTDDQLGALRRIVMEKRPAFKNKDNAKDGKAGMRGQQNGNNENMPMNRK